MDIVWIVVTYVLVLAAIIVLGTNMSNATNPWWVRFLLCPALLAVVIAFWVAFYWVLSA